MSRKCVEACVSPETSVRVINYESEAGERASPECSGAETATVLKIEELPFPALRRYLGAQASRVREVQTTICPLRNS